MSVTTSPAAQPEVQVQTQIQTITSLQNGQYIPESVLNVSQRHALLWGCQRGVNWHLAFERITEISSGDAEIAQRQKTAIMNLNHENIARCIDVFTEDNALYIAMVTGEGKPLAQRTEQITTKGAVEIGIQICNALNYLSNHTEFISHGAIEPSTIFLTDGNRVKLTNQAALLGIMPPSTEPDGARHDVFGVGATMHYALTHWTGNYRLEVPPLAELCANISPELCAIITRALAPNPADRWANSAELRYALLRI